MVRAVAVCLAAWLAQAGVVSAQPQIKAIVRPAPNAAGWNNSVPAVFFVCDNDTDAGCPRPASVNTEGRGQSIVGKVADGGGRETAVSIALNVDRTPPRVTIHSPVDGVVTSASFVRVAARAEDALSGVTTATCNGRLTQVDASGGIQCVVPLAPGVNDIVIEAADAADNSGSAGIRVTRIGVPSLLRILPESAAVLVGQSRTLQVVDNFGRPAPDVMWRVANPQILEMSPDGANTIRPKSPGTTIVTAVYGGLSVDATITVYAGDAFPTETVIWKIASLRLVQTPDRPARPGRNDARLLALLERPRGSRAVLTAIEANTGRVSWIERPALDDGERAVAQAIHRIGGVLMITAAADGTSSLVHSAAPDGPGPWRYRSAGRLAGEMAQDGDGQIVVVETDAGGFPKALAIDGRTGVVRARVWLPSGFSVLMNANCVAGANSGREIPPDVGAPTVQPDGSLTFELVRVDDLEDDAPCGAVGGRLRRVVYAASIGAGGTTNEMLATYEVPAGSPPPTVTLFPIASDEHGGRLAPWTVRFDERTTESHIAHFSASGRQDYRVPAAGAIVPVGMDLGAMTDGTTLLAFHLLTGEVKWTRTFSTGGVKIIPGPIGRLYVSSPAGSQLLDEFGRVVKVP